MWDAAVAMQGYCVASVMTDPLVADQVGGRDLTSQVTRCQAVAEAGGSTLGSRVSQLA